MRNGRASLFGIAGAVLIGFGTIAAALLGLNSSLTVFHLAFGSLFLLIWLVRSGIGGIVSMLSKEAVGVSANRGSLLGFILVLVCLIGINWLGTLPALEYRKDFTEGEFLTLSEQSKKLTQALTHPIEMVAFVTSEDQRRLNRYRTLLDLYAYESSLVAVRIVDPIAQPQLVEKYGMREGDILYLGYQAEQQKKIERRLGRVSELVITANLSELLKTSSLKIYYIIGHDEPDLEGDRTDGLRSFTLTLSKERFAVQPLFLGAHGKIPGDAAMLVLISPSKPLLPEEVDRLIGYVESGGRLLLMCDPGKSFSEVAPIAKRFGIEIGENVVVDLKQRLSADTEPVANAYATHAVTDRLSNQDMTVFTIASSVRRAADVPADGSVTELVFSGPASWGETNLSAIFGEGEAIVNIEPDELRGPISLAAAYEKKIPSIDGQNPKVSRVLAFGDSDWVQNSRIKLFSNRDLLLNAVSWVSGDEGSIMVRPKVRQRSEFPLTHDTMLLFLLLSFLVPELVVIVGIYHWWQRSHVPQVA